MINIYLTFGWVYLAMIATSFWEAYVEGNHPWDKGKLGWKLKIGNYTVLTAYHFWLFFIMYPVLMTLPFIIFGFDWRLFGIVLSAYSSGVIVEDFGWFLVNPKFSIKWWNPKHVTWYPWLKCGKLAIPLFYIVGIVISLLSWYFLWR